MSKKQKPHQKQQKKVHSQDINESDQTEFFGLLSDDYVNNGNLKVAQKILGDYKALLEYPPNQFWATLSYNLNLQNSLDLFIRYAPRKHFLTAPLHLTGYYGTIVKEIFRSVFAIYLRLTDLEQEDSVLFDQIGAYDLVYQKWIFDIMKLTDLCTIYGEQNESATKRICHFVFKYQAYQDDYKSTVDSFYKNILQKLYEDLFTINNKSANETEIIISDIQQKMEILTLALDSIETVITWARFFPQQHYLFKPELMACFEQIFYEFLLAKGYCRVQTLINGVWRAQHLGNIQCFLKQATQRIIDFFVIYMQYLDELVKTKQSKQLQDHMMYIIQNFGILKRKFKSKKGNSSANKEWMLFEAIAENGFSMIELLMNVPWNSVNIPKEDVEEVTIMMTSIMDERESIKMKNNQQLPQIDLDVFQNFNPADTVLAKELLNADEKEEAEVKEDQAEEVEVEGQQQREEKLVELVPKKKQKLAFDQPLKDRIEMAELTVKLYNDEPDDTYDYQEALQRPEKEYTSSDDDVDNDIVVPLHQQRDYKVISKKPQQTQYSTSYQNLDGRQKVIQKKQDNFIKRDEADFSGGEDQYSRNNYNNNNNQQQQVKQQKYFVKGEDLSRDEGNKRNEGNYKKYDNKNRTNFQDKSDYIRNDEQRDKAQTKNLQTEPVKVLSKKLDRDGGYVGKNKTKMQEEYEEKQQQEQQSQDQYQQKQNNKNKGNQQFKEKKSLNRNSKPFDDVYVPKDQVENTNEYKEEGRKDDREGKRQHRGGRKY